MSPWNYPFLLTIEPLVDAIAAGNTAILKPSAYSPATSEVIRLLIHECFDPKYVSVVTGGRAENTHLLSLHFDYIFFTGSQAVGKEVMRKASEYLTPVTLELGGKSPCIVDKTANLRLAAKRIVFGKFLNCGQTCVAPDYIYCDPEIKDALVAELRRQISRQYGKEPLKNRDYGKIINEKHFDRINSLIDPAKTVCGGGSSRETLQIEPTVLDNVTFDDPVMQPGDLRPGTSDPHLRLSRKCRSKDQLHGSSTGPLPLHQRRKNRPGSNFPVRFRRRLHQRCPHPSGHQQYGLRRLRRKRHGLLPRHRRLPDIFAL